MKTLHLNRRAVLRGAWGTAIALPTLNAMLTGKGWVRAANGAVAPPPRRLLGVLQSNGAEMADWWPKSGAGTATYPLSPLLEPLGAELGTGVKARDYVSLLGGLDYIGAAGHSSCRLFTGETQPSTCGMSLDQELARRLPVGTTRLQSVHTAAEQQIGDADHQPFRLFVSWTGNNKPVTTMSYDSKTGSPTDPKELFAKLFPSRMPGPVAAPDHTKSVLDAVIEDANRLGAQLGKEDRLRVQEHLAAIRELEVDLFQAAPAAGVCESPAEPPKPENGRKRAEQILSLLVMAFKCDITRYATFMFGPGMSQWKNPWVINGTRDDHNWAHIATAENGGAAYRRAVGRARTEMIVNAMREMWQCQEGDGRLLDNTLLLYSNEASQGHSERDVPVFLAGRGGGTHKPGKFTRYAEGTLYVNLLLTMMNMMGVDAAKFGRSGTKILPNLLS